MYKRTLSFAIVATLIWSLSSCSSASKDQSAETGNTEETGREKLQGSISISGAFALYPLANVWAQEFNKIHPDVRFNISGGGAGKGMADVLAGATDVGMFSREIAQAEKDKGVWWVAVTKDAVVPTISAKNPILNQLKKEGLTLDELNRYFIQKDVEKTWKSSGEKVNVYTRSDGSGAAATFAKFVGGEAQEDLQGIAVNGDPGLAEAVKNDAHGLGYNNIVFAYNLTTGHKNEGIEVVPVDLNANGIIDPEEDFYDNIDEITTAVAEGKYPSPPARELYFITKGEPTNIAVTAFLKWVLNEGQAFVVENGYVQLNTKIIDEQQTKLK